MRKRKEREEGRRKDKVKVGRKEEREVGRRLRPPDVCLGGGALLRVGRGLGVVVLVVVVVLKKKKIGLIALNMK